MSKVVKNTGLLYVRSIIILIITLYSSRVLLSTLGVDDYGLYNLVGGVVGLFASLKGLFAFAVQRFLSFAKGKSNIEKERDVFTVSFYLHIGIALIFALVVECFGLWFIANKLNIEKIIPRRYAERQLIRNKSNQGGNRSHQAQDYGDRSTAG